MILCLTDFVKSWRSLMRLRVDITEFVSFILLYAAVEVIDFN